MKANELRIGNILNPVRPRYGECFIIVESIGTDCINADFRPYNLPEVEPILLTEEWLAKLGFKYFLDTKIYAIDNFFIEKEPDNKIAVMYDYLNKSVEYVHQLQNLYFALTGEELICLL